MEDWGLQALIRPKDHDHEHDHHHHHHHHQQQHLINYQEDYLFGSIDDMEKEYDDQALLFSFSHDLLDQHHDLQDHGCAIATTMETIDVVVKDELNQIYKPFYQLPAVGAAADVQTIHHHHHHHLHDYDPEIQQDLQEQEIKKFSGSAPTTSQVTPKLKKRKNQQKRVVAQVTADGLSSDPWAWRKYGQKPIKGSIYPRSYYRCSSSKGCMARRQVEQSCTDSSIYILTYTADHNHPQPTRRNSLAGINRSRFKASTPKSPTTSDGGKTVAISKDSPFDSPSTLSVSSIEDEVLQQSFIKQESEETLFYNKFENQGHTIMSGIIDDDYMVFSNDFFEGLEDLGGYKMDSSSYNSSTKQFPHVFC